MQHRNFLALGVFGLAAFYLSSCSESSARSPHSEPQQEHAERKLAPDFTLKDADGASVALSQYRGKVVLLNFWATWCGPCSLEIPWFEEFEQQYRAQGFEVLGVSMDEDGWTAVKPYLRERKINYRVVLGDDSVTQLYGGVDSLPTSFMIDRHGKIAYVHVGLASKNDYLSEIQGLLGAKQTNTSTAALRVLPASLIGRPAK